MSGWDPHQSDVAREEMIIVSKRCQMCGMSPATGRLCIQYHRRPETLYDLLVCDDCGAASETGANGTMSHERSAVFIRGDLKIQVVSVPVNRGRSSSTAYPYRREGD